MPNYCYNKAIFTHEKPAMIQDLIEAANSGGLFNTFVPRPPEKEEDWYSWNIENWGTKWDIPSCDLCILEDENEVRLGFDTAWTPPIQFYQRMEELGFCVKAYYHEPGMNFCGLYEDGFDEYVEIEGGSQWVRDNVPEYIDEAFSISESMEEYED